MHDDPVPPAPDALSYATEKHEGQMRRDRQTPYISHPARVSKRLADAGVEDPNILAAAVLHDVVEDTGTPLQEIVEVFGPDVAQLVEAVTRNPGQTGRAFVDQIRSADPRACLIKLSDRLDNLQDWAGMEASFRRPYALEGVRIVEAVLSNARLPELSPDQTHALHRVAAELLAACCALLDEPRWGRAPRNRPHAPRVTR